MARPSRFRNRRFNAAHDYNAGGTLVAEFSAALSQTQQVSYLTTDHLGSPRVITNENGAVTTRQDFSAFGDERLTAQRTQGLGYKPDSIRQDYTGYQKDDESGGLEFAQARYYNTKHGRFTSIDPLTASANAKDPQTFNRYSYAMNSPYKLTDPLGLISEKTGACGNRCANSGDFVDGSAFRGRDASFDWSKQTQTRTVTITGGTAEQREAVQKSIDTLKDQSPFVAGQGFALFEGEGKGSSLTIEILDDATFEAIAELSGGGDNTKGITTAEGGDAADPTVKKDARIYLKAGDINITQENKDRKDNKETFLEGVLGHELGHAVDISRDYKAWKKRNDDDKTNKTNYLDRNNEQFADAYLKIIAFERQLWSEGKVKVFQDSLRFPKTVIRKLEK